MILTLTQSLTRQFTKQSKLLIASFMSSSFVPLYLIYPNELDHLWVKVLISIFMILLAFGYRNLKVFTKLIAVLYFTTFTMGGGLLATHFLMNQSASPTHPANNYGGLINWMFVAVSFPFVFIFTKKRMDEHKYEKFQYDQTYKVKMEWNEKVIDSIGYVDSGNHMHDPITNQPVIICDPMILNQWFSLNDMDKIKSLDINGSDSIDALYAFPFLRIVPYQVVGGSSKFMFVFKIDRLSIFVEDNPIIIKKTLVGMEFDQFHNDQNYHCLLHPKLIESNSSTQTRSEDIS